MANELDQYLTGTPSPTPDAPTGAGSGLDAYLRGESSSPVNGQTSQPDEAPPTHVYQDPNQSWGRRAWDLANTPLTESVLGWNSHREGAGGFERGVENILSGFTSPLSLALTAGTFGTGGMIESAGATALREAGLSAEQIAAATKGSQAALQAANDLKPVEPVINSALETAGHDVGLFNRAKAALGPGDLSEKFGDDVVKAGLEKQGFSPEEIDQLGKASQVAQQAKAGFTPVEDAVRDAGVDPSLWKRAQATLYDNGLTEHDLLGGNAVERGAFQILRKTLPDLPIAHTVRMAKTANTLLNAGFTFQQLETASAMSPRFLDALKEGDYDHALEYGTEAAAGAGFGILGASHALNSAGELFKPVLENTKFRPNDEWMNLERGIKERDAQHALAEDAAVRMDKSVRDILGHKPAGPLGKKPEVADQEALELASVFHQVVTGGDANKAASWHNALAEAKGIDDRVQTPQDKAVTDSPNFKNWFGKSAVVDAAGKPMRVYKSMYPYDWEDASNKEPLDVINRKTPFPSFDSKDPEGVKLAGFFSDSPEFASGFAERAGTGQAIYPAYLSMQNPYIVDAAGEKAGNIQFGPSGKGFRDAIRSGKYDGVVIKNTGDEGNVYVALRPEQIKSQFNSGSFDPASPSITDYASRPVNGQTPDNLPDLIKTQNFTKTPEKYQDLVLNSLKRVAQGKLSDKEMAAAEKLRSEDANNYQIGSVNDLLHNWIEDHITRVYKDLNPQGKVIASSAKNGKFSTQVSMARHQVYDSHLTALLKSPKEIVLDPVSSVAQGRGALIRAAANRQLIDTLRDNFTRASDGRPAVVLSGAGQVISGPNGEDPKTMIQPNRVRSTRIADAAVQQMDKTGDLQRFLEDGTVKDITPKVTPQNIQDFISRIQDKAGKTEAQYDAVGSNKLRTDEMMLKSILNNQDWGRLDEYNAAQPKMYAFDPQDYVSLAHPSFKAWKFAASDPSGNPVFVHSDITAHPEFAQYLKDRLGLEKGAISQSAIGKAVLGAGAKLKHTLLSLSPFHMMQIALRGIQTGVNPLTLGAPDLVDGAKVDPSDPNSPTILRKLVEHGYTTGTDYKSLQEHSEGVSTGGGALAKLPGPAGALGRSMNWYQDFLFKRYIPAVKATAAEKLFGDYQRAYPDWSVDKVARATAQHANESFGGVNWRAMGRSATTQDWGRLLLLAPDWLESELRSGARLFGDESRVQRAQVAKMALGTWGIARVLNLITTGNAHYEAPFGVATKNKEGKEVIYGMRTLPQDLLSAASDPVGFLRGRLSPTVAGLTELSTGRDRLGRKLGPQDLWIDTLRNMAPLPLQAVGQALTGGGPDVGNTGQLAKAVGGTAQTYRSPGEELAAELAASHSESGPVDPAQMARHRQIMHIEDQLRAGEVSWPEINRLAYTTDQIHLDELKRIQNNYKATQGMDAETARLYTRMARLPAPQFLQVWDLLGPQEKTQLVPLMRTTAKRYINKARKDQTPAQRQQDPTFNRIVNTLPMLDQEQVSRNPP